MEELNSLSDKIIGLAIKVHRSLGPGLLEGAYQQCLAYELSKAGIRFRMEHPIAVRYDNIRIDCTFRADLLVEDSVIVELKSVDRILPIHEAQLLTYLRLSDLRLGLLMNFNARVLKNGIRRFVL
jgi:GxxExxY protein